MTKNPSAGNLPTQNTSSKQTSARTEPPQSNPTASNSPSSNSPSSNSMRGNIANKQAKPGFPVTSLRSGQALSTLIHKLGHEIGNPLTSIISFATVMNRINSSASDPNKTANSVSSNPIPSEKIDLYTQSIIDEAWRIAAINERLVLLLSERLPQDRACDLHKTIAQVFSKVKRKFPSVTCHLESSTVKVLIEEGQLKCLAGELLHNALEAASLFLAQNPNSISDHPIVHVRISPDGVLTIANYTVGPSSLPMDRLYEPFVTASFPNHHLGLGLTVAYAIVDRFRGDIVIEESMHDNYCVFSVHVALPLEPRADASHGPNASHEVPFGLTVLSELSTILPPVFSVLIIDDEPTIASAIQKILELVLGAYTDVQCQIAHDRDALRFLEEGMKYEIILCDLKLRGTSGHYIFEIVSQRWPQEVHKLAFLTGDQRNPDTQQFLQQSGRPYLYKPFESEQLLALILNILQTTLQSNQDGN